MPVRLAITGGNGFIGRHVVAAAVEGGHSVVAVVRSQEAARLVGGLGAEAALVPGLEQPSLQAAFDGAAGVIHLAQIGRERDGTTYDQVNVAGTEAVAAAARRVGARRLVFLSGLGVGRYGVKPRCTNRYFLSKLAAEVCLFSSGLEVTVLRPSYVLGPGGELVPTLVRELDGGEVEQIDDGAHRMQPIAVGDAAHVILASLERVGPGPRVLDLVGPEPLRYADLVERVAACVARRRPLPPYRLRSIRPEEADRLARTGGYRGMQPDELDCLLCDEVGDPRALVALLGRDLVPLDEALGIAVDAALAEG